MELVSQSVFSFLACVGFCILFNLKRPKFICIASFIGMIGWAVFILLPESGPSILRYILATITVSSLSEIFARIEKAPATVFLLPGIIPLVPGSGLYYAMNHLINGDYPLFAQTLLETAAYAGCIAVGASFVTAIVRMIKFKRRPIYYYYNLDTIGTSKEDEENGI